MVDHHLSFVSWVDPVDEQIVLTDAPPLFQEDARLVLIRETDSTDT